MTREENLQRILEDPYCRHILDSSFEKGRTLNFLSMKFNIPASVCHRMIISMVKSKLMSMDRKIMTSQGKWTQLYRSNIRTDPNDPLRFIARTDPLSGLSESLSAEELYKVQEVLT